MPDSSIVHSMTDIVSEIEGRAAVKWNWNNGLLTHEKQQKLLDPNRNSSNETMISNKDNFHISGDSIIIFGKDRKIDRTGSVPIDGEDTQIYSEEVAVMPYSFYDDNNNYDTKAPPPWYFRFEEINKPKHTLKDDVLAAFTVNKNGYLECTDEKITDANKGVIPYVLKQMAKNVLTGQGIISISLPVRIFQPKSLLERILDAWSFIPTFFEKASKTKDPIRRMKYVISSIVAGMYMSADLRKPFNPILGETLQGYFKDGSIIFMEHISHHPPISSFLIEGPKAYPYRLSGSVEFKAGMKSYGNILNISFAGANYVEFPDGHVIEFHYPTTRVSGLVMGDRTCNIEGTGILIDHEYPHRGIVVFNPDQPEFPSTTEPTNFEGLIYRSESKEIQKKEIKSLRDVADIEEEIWELHGNVLENLVIDGEEFWNIDNFLPHRYSPDPYCLPSDSRYREDLIWLVYEDQTFSQAWKEKLESQQRKDRKIRKDAEQKRKKKGTKFIE
jgi:hypothetical protein